MKVGIIGLPQTGKKTLFQVLTGNEVQETGGPLKPIPGTANIVDQRFDRLVTMYQPKKETRARIDFVLLPKLEQEVIVKGDVFRDISDVDTLCHVVRAFEDDSIYHAAGSVDPLRDVAAVNAELQLHDQLFLEKRIDRLETGLKKVKDERQLKELALLKRMQEHLENDHPLRLLELSEEEDLLIRSYPLLTRKEMILVFNIGEDQVNDTSLLDRVQDLCAAEKMEAMVVSAGVESEIALLDSEEERREFLQDMGIEEPALEVLTGLCLKALGRISFFTVGKDEVHQWLVRTGSPAPVAAGVIHSDLQKGFIRAEVIKYDELIALGSEAELKKAGKLAVQGKDYTVVDGDILNIRFNV
ncbi:redox-regulated ATPase YchF [Desulfobulbus oligotrophicus]|uniref:Redox-regulated ATPase YchF n=1 Tax=Desulfobulbus oligotrophicus TaxID=1909699 RepID=A0A7T5VBI2_9BACT|nr:redox-regulated ATPase YchF [Desulfobulbus oligotrophicus]QQG64736.1 redox-regulated ATPase YchF [Desulfobulbus oligotrophicus]